jgi:hypothetical protein
LPKVDAKTYERAFAKALAYAKSRIRGHRWSESDLAQELAQEAMTASFDPARYPWDGEKPLEKHAMNVVRSLLSDRADAAKLRRDPRYAVPADEALKRAAMPADALTRVREQREARERRHEWMLSQLVGLTRAVYLLYVRDVFEPAAQAAALGVPLAAIYEARRRVAEVARAAPAAGGDAGELANEHGDAAEDDGGDGDAGGAGDDSGGDEEDTS